MDYNELADLLYPNVKYDIKYFEEKFPKRNLPEEAMVLRFAPSPTGFVHMGSLLTAFLNRFLTNQTKGIFILRIEDTDEKRTVENGIYGIIEDLKAVDIQLDEGPEIGGNYGPYIQTDRQEIYDTFAKFLISSGKAYPCFCTEEEIEEIRHHQETKKIKMGYSGKYATCRNLSFEEIKEKLDNNIPYTIRIKSNGDENKKIILNDLRKGKIEFPENDIDYILIKSNKVPVYHFAALVDDYLMRITHIIRSEEWVSSYPVHYDIYKAFGFEIPNIAHLATVNKLDNGSIRKLSKRKDDEAKISFYYENGIPNDVLKLYLLTIANSNFEEWYNNNPNANYADFPFTFEKMSKSGPLFDLEKLYSISRIYFSRLKANALYESALKHFEKYDKDFYELINKYKDYTINVLNIEREIDRPRKDIVSYSSIKNEIDYMYDELFAERKTEIKEFYTSDFLFDYIDKIYDEKDDKQTWFNKIKEFCPAYGFTSDNKEYKENPEKFKGNVSHACELIRVAVTDRTQTPDLYEILRLLGKERIKERFNSFKTYIGK